MFPCKDKLFCSHLLRPSLKYFQIQTWRWKEESVLRALYLPLRETCCWSGFPIFPYLHCTIMCHIHRHGRVFQDILEHVMCVYSWHIMDGSLFIEHYLLIDLAMKIICSMEQHLLMWACPRINHEDIGIHRSRKWYWAFANSGQIFSFFFSLSLSLSPYLLTYQRLLFCTIKSNVSMDLFFTCKIVKIVNKPPAYVNTCMYVVKSIRIEDVVIHSPRKCSRAGKVCSSFPHEQWFEKRKLEREAGEKDKLTYVCSTLVRMQL